jgi:hypothetical protein
VEVKNPIAPAVKREAEEDWVGDRVAACGAARAGAVSEGWPTKKKNRAATPERLFFQTFPRLDHIELFGEPFEINILLYDALVRHKQLMWIKVRLTDEPLLSARRFA